jgi:hypothetical protein
MIELKILITWSTESVKEYKRSDVIKTGALVNLFTSYTAHAGFSTMYPVIRINAFDRCFRLRLLISSSSHAFSNTIIRFSLSAKSHFWTSWASLFSPFRFPPLTGHKNWISIDSHITWGSLITWMTKSKLESLRFSMDETNLLVSEMIFSTYFLRIIQIAVVFVEHIPRSVFRICEQEDCTLQNRLSERFENSAMLSILFRYFTSQP